jgi:GNAT superfamily N-acetyltransferase
MSATAKPEFVIDKLSRGHDLSSFDCANVALNEWLVRFAWPNQQSDSAKTYVTLDGNRAVGYYALTTGSVHKHESPQRVAKGLANHPIGVVLLARLAVDQNQQGKGLGKALLFDALSRIAEAADIVGVRAVLVHAIDESARRFYLHFGFEESPIDPYQLLLLLKDLRKAILEGS